MPLVRSINSCSYAPLNPPDIRTFNCADAAAGQNSNVAKIANEKVFMINSSPARSWRFPRNYSHITPGRNVAALPDSDLAYVPFGSNAEILTAGTCCLLYRR